MQRARLENGVGSIGCLGFRMVQAKQLETKQLRFAGSKVLLDMTLACPPILNTFLLGDFICGRARAALSLGAPNTTQNTMILLIGIPKTVLGGQWD